MATPHSISSGGLIIISIAKGMCFRWSCVILIKNSKAIKKSCSFMLVLLLQPRTSGIYWIPLKRDPFMWNLAANKLRNGLMESFTWLSMSSSFTILPKNTLMLFLENGSWSFQERWFLRRVHPRNQEWVPETTPERTLEETSLAKEILNIANPPVIILSLARGYAEQTSWLD